MDRQRPGDPFLLLGGHQVLYDGTEIRVPGKLIGYVTAFRRFRFRRSAGNDQSQYCEANYGFVHSGHHFHFYLAEGRVLHYRLAADRNTWGAENRTGDNHVPGLQCVRSVSN